jgi:hypothetical protein
MPQYMLKHIYPMIGSLGEPFTASNTGEATTVPHVDGWKSALTATSEAQIARVDFNGGLYLDIDKIKTVKWRVKFGAMPSGTDFYFGLATANASAVDDITARLLFQLESGYAITVRSDDGTTDSGDVATPWTAASGEQWEFVADFASGIKHAIPSYMSKTGKDAIQIFGGKVGSGRQPLGALNISLENLTGGLQLYSRLDKASGDGLGDATIQLIEIEMAR